MKENEEGAQKRKRLMRSVGDSAVEKMEAKVKWIRMRLLIRGGKTSQRYDKTIMTTIYQYLMVVSTVNELYIKR